eukprot:15729642-Heterocapsa_arctica.AAC.1
MGAIIQQIAGERGRGAQPSLRSLCPPGPAVPHVAAWLIICCPSVPPSLCPSVPVPLSLMSLFSDPLTPFSSYVAENDQRF